MQILEHSLFGLRSARLKFTKADSLLSVTLFPMVHVGEPQFFNDVYEDAFSHDIALVEGVNSPAVRRLTRAYRWMNVGKFGWVIQPKSPASADVRADVVNVDLSPSEFEEHWRQIPLRTRAVIIAGSAFFGISSRWTETPNSLGKRLETDDLPRRRNIMSWSPEYSGLSDLISVERDKRLIENLETTLNQYSEQECAISIVYGAGHMPAILRYLHARGFSLSESAWMKIFST